MTPAEIADRVLERLPISTDAPELIREALIEVVGEASTIIGVPRIQPGDVLVLTCPGRLSEETVARLKAKWEEAMRSPAKYPIVVLEGDLKPSCIVSREPAGAAE
jgi:hypothetical protein